MYVRTFIVISHSEMIIYYINLVNYYFEGEDYFGDIGYHMNNHIPSNGSVIIFWREIERSLTLYDMIDFKFGFQLGDIQMNFDNNNNNN